MRLVLLLFGLVASTLAASLGEEFVPEDINSRDDAATRWLRSVIANLDDPRITPLHYVEDFDFGNSLVTLRGHLRNLRIHGLRGIVVNRFTVNWLTLRFDFDITIPHLRFVGDFYDLRGRFVSILPIFGNGPFTIDMWNFNIVGHTTLTTRGNGMLEMRNLDSRSRLQRFETNFHNFLFGGEFGDLWNYIMSNMLPNIMENYHREVTQVVEEAMLPRFNERLNALTVNDLRDILNGVRVAVDEDIEKPEPYVAETSSDESEEIEKPEPYQVQPAQLMEPYEILSEEHVPVAVDENIEKPEPYVSKTSSDDTEEIEKPEPYQVKPVQFQTEKFPSGIRIPVGKTTWITSITVKN